MKKKIRVAVLYGGKSGEHEVSLMTGASVIQHLNKDEFEVIPVSIDKAGRWQWNDLKLIEEKRGKSLSVYKDAPELLLKPTSSGQGSLVPVNSSGPTFTVDVVFPAIHGPLCEDGTVQGMLELANVAYVGSGVLGSAVSMDKDMAKRLAASAGIPIAPFLALKKETIPAKRKEWTAQIQAQFQLPVFVKPSNMGSSVGVHKVKNWTELLPAIEDAFRYDLKVLVEAGVDAREIELAVLEQDDGSLFVSLPSEIKTLGSHEFYSYEAKYLDESGSAYDLPAKISAEQTKEAQEIARKAFVALECNGMARVDLFLSRTDGRLYFNEVNTIPGFTSISMYPKMMEASGVPYSELLSRLIHLALLRQKKRSELKRDFGE